MFNSNFSGYNYAKPEPAADTTRTAAAKGRGKSGKGSAVSGSVNGSALLCDNVAAASLTKTPISVLNEMLRKCRPARAVTFNEIACEGPVHDRRFTIRCSIGADSTEYSTVGVAGTKKLAKQKAAKELLLQLAKAGWSPLHGLPAHLAVEYVNCLMPELDNPVGEAKAVSDARAKDQQNQNHPVTKLAAMCIKKNWFRPDYEFSSEDGPPHDRTYVMVAKIAHLQAIGDGPTKKGARKEAAAKMLELIAAQNDFAALVAGPVKQKDKKPKRKFTPWPDREALLLAMCQLDDPAKVRLAYSEQLADVAAALDLQYAYNDIVEKNIKGEHQCFIRFQRGRELIGIHSANSQSMAREACARAALEYMRFKAGIYHLVNEGTE